MKPAGIHTVKLSKVFFGVLLIAFPFLTTVLACGNWPTDLENQTAIAEHVKATLVAEKITVLQAQPATSDTESTLQSQ